MKKFRFLLGMIALCTAVLLFPKQTVQAESWEISDISLVTEVENLRPPKWMFDGDRRYGSKSGPNASMTLSSEDGLGSLYLIFETEAGEYTLTDLDSGKEITCGRQNFLHDYLNLTQLLGSTPKNVKLQFGEDPVTISELRVFTEGEPPTDVQQWQLPPEDGVDMLLFSTHGDDEQLFFAGVLPYYAGELDYEVVVAYSTRHANYGTVRPHEMLDGLWAVGVRNYPVFGPFDDYYTKTLNQAEHAFERRGIDLDEILSYVVEQIRKYKPLVVLGHDQNGEYGHGMHRLYSAMVRQAVEISMDPEQFPESAEAWGTWDVPKTYIHLYPENPIHMDWDIPLEAFGGDRKSVV